ncbi:MAG TPA: ABC transporter permease [Candidatus Limnocylindrales bacterium]|nr:ABC transporter permease [Candidatus Limnocylindrales bacterium]
MARAAAAKPLVEPIPAARRRMSLGRRVLHWALPVYTALAVAYLLLPIAVMIIFGFNNPAGRFNFTWQGFTLANYASVFNLPALNTALTNSLIVATISTIVATALGTLIALALTRYQFRGRGPVNLLVFIPIATPEVVLGASLLAMFLAVGMARDIGTITIAHILFNISFVVVTVRARIAGYDRMLEEAAMDLGANEWTTFRKVTFPLIFPGVLAAALLAFALSIDDFVVTLFTAGQTTTFPLWVYGVSRFGVPAEVNVMGTIIFAIALVFILGYIVIQRRSAGSQATLPASIRAPEAER